MLRHYVCHTSHIVFTFPHTHRFCLKTLINTPRSSPLHDSLMSAALISIRSSHGRFTGVYSVARLCSWSSPHLPPSGTLVPALTFLPHVLRGHSPSACRYFQLTLRITHGHYLVFNPYHSSDSCHDYAARSCISDIVVGLFPSTRLFSINYVENFPFQRVPLLNKG